MNKVVLLLLFSLVGWISCYTPEEQAALRFWDSLKKHAKLCDQDIFDPDFHIGSPDIRFSYRKSVEIICEAANNLSSTLYKGALSASFTNDGLLRITHSDRNRRVNYHALTKPNKNIEGGYKLLRVDVN